MDEKFENENEYYTPNNGAQPHVEENTTYHYSYSGGNRNFGGTYYTPPGDESHETVFNGSPVGSAEAAVSAPRKKSKTVKILVIILIISFAAVAVGLIISLFGGNGSSSAPSDNNSGASVTPQIDVQSQVTQDTVSKNGSLTVSGVAENCIDSCVGITVYTKRTNYYNFYGYGSGSQNSGESVASGTGSGVLMLEDDGKTYIMTCAHVISDGTSFTVTLNNGKEYDAEIVGYDSQTDIGVLSINATGLSIAEFADSKSTVLGEQVVAIGCPGGLQFMNSITSGYVSALARPISSSIGYNNECIQIDAAINPGNSGGALFNMQGQVIGINSSKIANTAYEGMGFAVPSSTAVSTANSLIKTGYVEGRAKIGITYNKITSYSNAEAILNALEKLGYKDAGGTIVINSVSEESDLASKGIKKYDMVVAVNGETLTSTDVLTSILSKSKPGDTVTLTVARIEDNEIDDFEVKCVLIEDKG